MIVRYINVYLIIIIIMWQIEKHLSECLKECRVSVSSFRYGGRLFHADGPAHENAVYQQLIVNC